MKLDLADLLQRQLDEFAEGIREALRAMRADESVERSRVSSTASTGDGQDSSPYH